MKKVAFSILVGILSTGLFAQDLTFPNWVDIVTGTTLEWNITSYGMDVINTSGMSLSLRVEKNQIVTVNTTGYYFCWGPTCQDTDDTLSTETVVMADGDTNTTFLSYARISSNSSNAGISTIEYCFFDINGDIADFCVNQYFDVSYVSGLLESEIKEQSFKVSAQRGAVLVSVNKATENLRVNIYDTTGRLVSSQVSSDMRNVRVSTEGFPAGGYVVSVVSSQKVIGSKSVILLQ
ncbi:MAG: T9SS type A sorting domain-containing protein [Flavobacteriales bacterium]|nr:T9SS type A sorting domain-containing protein [Flavobacteriales bacterium]